MRKQTRTLKLSAWFTAVVLQALIAVGCAGQGVSEKPSQARSEEGIVTPQVNSTIKEEVVPTKDPVTANAENMAAIAKYEPLVERAQAVRPKYEALFWRQPNVVSVGIGFIKDENGEWTEEVGLVISVSQKVDQNTLPPEDRIPIFVEGVPVQIRERGPVVPTTALPPLPEP